MELNINNSDDDGGNNDDDNNIILIITIIYDMIMYCQTLLVLLKRYYSYSSINFSLILNKKAKRF